MRKWNAVISVLLLILLAVHGLYGFWNMAGVLPGGNAVMQVLSHVMVILLCLHMGIGIKLTADSVKAIRKTGVFYARENRLFLARRISGLLIAVSVVFHIMIMSGEGSGTGFRLAVFGKTELFVHLLFALSLLVHILTNIRPLYLSLGSTRLKRLLPDVLFGAVLILLCFAVGFIVYYLRWNVLWR